MLEIGNWGVGGGSYFGVVAFILHSMKKAQNKTETIQWRLLKRCKNAQTVDFDQ